MKGCIFMDEKISELKQSTNEWFKERRVISIILSILMVIVGMTILFKPVAGLLWLEYVGIACLAAFGIFQIVKYFKTPNTDKVGWTLANGIILLVLSSLYVFSGPLLTMLTFSLIFSILAISDSMNMFTLSAQAKRSGEGGSGLLIFSGIIDLVIGIFFIITPIIMNWAVGLIIGVYLIALGISVFAKACTGSNKI